MKILVISDVHGISKDIQKFDGYKGSGGGFLMVENRTTLENRILAIEELLLEEKLKPDLIFVLGDLAHEAIQLAAQQVWTDIHTIASNLGVCKDRIFGVTGNHDVLSRATETDELYRQKFINELIPSFPSSNAEFNTQYLSHGVAKTEKSDCLIICVNTCFMHGTGGKNTEAVANKGQISPQMIVLVEQYLTASSAKLNVIAMHHHPRKIDEITDPHYDQMDNGEDLLSVVKQSRKNVIMLHGHKHLVGLNPVDPSCLKQWIFSSSSLAARAYSEMENYFTNQCHLVDIDLEQIGDSNLSGNVFSWDWNTGRKWCRSTKEGMPYKAAFGSMINIDAAIAEINSLPLVGLYEAQDLFACIPSLQFTPPKVIKKLVERMASRNSTSEILFTANGEIRALTQEIPR